MLRRSLAPALLALAACTGTSATPPPTAEVATVTPTATVAITPTATASATASAAAPTPVETAAASATPPAEPPGKSVWIKHENSGRPLASLLIEEARKAAAAGLKPYVYIGAPWCPPCQALARMRGEPRMLTALAGTYIIELELEAWSKRELISLGLIAKTIPVFHEIRADGHSTGRKLNGDQWGGNVPAAMAPALEGFFRAK